MSDDEADLQMPAFKVPDADEDLDLDIPPTSGEEYLRRVRLERQQCSTIVVAEVEQAQAVKNSCLSKQITHTGGLQPAPSGYTPTGRWQQEQAADFSEVRQRLARQKACIRKQKLKPSVTLPDSEEVEEWCQLCFGHLNPPNKSGSPDNTNANTETCDTETAPTNMTGTLPLLSVVAHMDQPTVVQVLEYHINWFEATGFSHEQGMWLYALLARLEKPLEPEACSLLRTLARHSAALRATLASAEDPFLVPLNLIICLVARYFDQADLADDYR